MSAIVAALAVATSAALTGCGQRGPLYLPSVPPLPEKPGVRTVPETPETPEAPAASDGSQAPITLAPADSLGTATDTGSPTAPAAASNPAPDQ